jgi:mono/diheme cytochrome c family protein
MRRRIILPTAARPAFRPIIPSRAVHCAVCHGEDGYGGGIVVRRGFPAPPSLHQVRLRAAPAGQLYEVIVQGYGIMYPAGYRIGPQDRWAIVAYIHALQLSQNARLADVPSAERAKLVQP